MCVRSARFVVLGCAMLLSGACAATRYESAPLVPADSAVAFGGRSLADAPFRDFAVTALGRETEAWPPAVWDPAHLTVAALYFHSDVAVARTALQVAEAAIVTAGARPNPTLNVTAGYTTAPANPFVLDSAFTLTFETAGKRQYRVAGAERQVDAARFHLALVGWQVRSRVRSSLLELLTAERTLDVLRTEVGIRQEVVRLTQRQVDAGELAGPILHAAQADLLNATVSLRTTDTQVQQDRAVLAAALGLPTGALDRVTFTWPELDQPPVREPLADLLLQREAVLNRLDLRGQLGTYAAAEAALQLEIAKQYPDIQLGPGYSFADGLSKFLVGPLGLVLPVFHRNQGPIGEAVARRQQAGERFLALQAQVVGETEQALAAYRGALAEVDDANRLVAEQTERERLAQRAFEAGDTDNLTVTGARVLTVTTARVRLDALKRAETALGDLESAVQRPLERSWDLPRLPSVTNPNADLLKGRQP